VNTWGKRSREQGEKGVLDGRRGLPRRGKGALSAAEADQIRQGIAERTPDQLELPFALWTSRAVREPIDRRLAKRLGLTAVQLSLRRWGLTPQKPLARAQERQPAAVAAWLETASPAIARGARRARAAISWGDETGISNQDRTGRSHAPRGRTPVVARTATRITQSMIAAASNRGLMRVMLCDGALTAERFLAFLRRLVRDAGRTVILIVDNPRVHKAGKVQARVESHRHEIELYSLPPPAPEHNPSESLNNDLKQKLRQQPQPDPKEELIKRSRSVLRAVQRSPERVRAHFRPEPVRYAA
jgi:transposase